MPIKGYSPVTPGRRSMTGLTYEEISRSLELENGTVKSRISRARERLRKYILQNGNKPTAFRSND